MNAGDSEQTFAETVRENFNLPNVYRTEAPQRFLTRDERVFGRSLTVEEVEQDIWLRYTSDIDGCVLELNTLQAVKMPIRHLTIMPNDNVSLREIRGMLKKHIKLTDYSKSELMSFSNSVGFQLFYERGWEGWIALIPVHERGYVALHKQLMRQKALTAFLELRANFRKELTKLALRGIATRTLMKNDINNVRKLFLLPDDCSVILKALQTALNDVSYTKVRPILFCFRFGEKMTGGLSMSDFDRQLISKATVNAALNTRADSGVDLFWSTSGLHEIIGCRGTLGTCLSLSDCGNFQSNLDGRSMDIKPPLRTLCRFPNQLQFVQLYADLPHRQPSCRFHPVSGCIAGGMCFAKSTADAFLRDAQHYVSTLESNWMLMKESTCRLEFVVSMDSVPEHLNANDFINLSNLKHLLESTPLLVPFPPQTLRCIRHLGLWICDELKSLLQKYQKTGNVCATWQSYQLELASEKMLWGRPLCCRSVGYSVNLGPGCLGPSRSLTDQLGFLSLEPSSACMQTENSIPPPEIWTTSQSILKMIARSAGLHDHLDASYGVIGRQLVCVLLRDLHDVGNAACHTLYEDFFMEMKASKTRFKIVGAVTFKSLVQLLITKRRTELRMVFPCMCKLLERNNLPLEDIISAGLRELNLKHFPAIKTYDRHGHMVLTWSFKDNFWTIINNDRSQEITENTKQQISELVRGDLEKRGLIFVSKLKKTPKILPWVTLCLLRLKREKLDLDATVTILTYISCIAFIMQGWFVEYERLAVLVLDLPLPENKLVALEILSKLQLANLNFRNLKLRRLHFSIPHKLDLEKEIERPETKPEVNNDGNRDTEKEADEFAHKIDDDDDYLVFERNIDLRRQSKCQPVQKLSKTTWSSGELEILHDVVSSDGSVRQKYELFKSKCMQSNIPFRTFRAFETKLKRI